MMKSVFVSIVFLVAFASAYPAQDKGDISDVDFDPFGGDEPIVDTGYYGSYYPSLDSFYKRLNDVIASIRQSIASDGSGLGSSFGDLGKGNTTSYTKIIGNHKVEVNETEYKKDTDFGTSHVKVSFINVKPLHPDTIEPLATTEADTEPINNPINKDRESLEDSVENEIPSIDEARDYDIETFDMPKRNQFFEEMPIPYPQPIYYTDLLDDVSNDIEIKDINDEQPIRDLSNDIYVNDIMVADGVPPNPNAEFIK